MQMGDKPTKFRTSLTPTILGTVGLFFCLTFLLISELTQQRLLQSIQSFNQSIEAQGVLREVMATVTEIQAGHRAYFLTHQQHFLQPLPIAAERINRLTTRLQEIWSDSPSKLSFVKQLHNQVQQNLMHMDKMFKRFRNGLQHPSYQHEIDFINDTKLEDEQTKKLQREIDLAIGQEANHYQKSITQWNANVILVRIGIWMLTIANIILLALLYARLSKEQRRKALEAHWATLRQQELEALIADRTAVLSELSSTLQIEQEREKAKIARDIHDELGSLIISARMDITYVLFKLREIAPALGDKLTSAIQNLDASVDIKRRIIEELRPSALDTLGVVPALEWQTQQVCKRANLQADLDLADDLPEMPDTIAIALFRILQEALTNIVKYAKAKRVFVSLQLLDDVWTLIIKDNGIGLADGALSSPLSHGLSGMRQRVVSIHGTFSIGSLPGAGTTIEVHVPYTPIKTHSMSTSLIEA